MKKLLCGIVILIAIPALRANAQYNPYQLSVAAEATIQEQPPRITLSWLKDDSATSYTIYRYDTNAGWWTEAAKVSKNLSWIDTNVAIGVPYEYEILKQAHVGTSAVQGYGYVYTGIDVPGQASSGSVDLVVDDTFATALASELTRLESDLVADGWHVIRHDVKRSASVQSVKALIQNDMRQDTALHTLFLFGHVPVPYSGFLNPDGHPTHFGAWPADVYYGDTTTDWTDNVTDSLSLVPGDNNRNVAGDGKFDPSNTQEVDLQIGRVDLSNMPAFSLSEEQLLKQYLDKDHAFRTGTLTAPKRALISDNFGSYGEGFACDAWRNFGNLVGTSNLFKLDWFTTLDTAPYLWAYGCGGGDFTGASGVGTTSDFASKGSKAIFSMLFGSWFGDWNVQNNFLRAPLADATTLTCCWGGRPHWYFDHMAMGQTIGESTQTSENCFVGWLYDELAYSPPSPVQGVHMDLMGDPTLRMSYPQVPSFFASLAAQQAGTGVTVSWTSNQPAEGYYIYRAHHWNDVFALLNSVPDAAMSFTDPNPFLDSNYYEVRAVAKAGDIHGTYYVVGEASNPVIETNSAGVTASYGPARSIRIANDGPFLTAIVNYDSEKPARLAVYDLAGREVMVLDPALRGAGEHDYVLDSRSASWNSGIYFIRIESDGEPVTARFLITR